MLLSCHSRMFSVQTNAMQILNLRKFEHTKVKSRLNFNPGISANRILNNYIPMRRRDKSPRMSGVGTGNV